MALKAGFHRLILREPRERADPDVGGVADPAGARQFHMPPPRAMARFAVDGQRGEPRLVASRDGVEGHQDLAAVALLATLEPFMATENARRWPVTALRQRDRGRRGDGAAVATPVGVAEPDAGHGGIVERQEAQGAVAEFRE